MKVKGNKELNVIFKIMGIFSVVTLTIGLGLGYNIRDFLVDMDSNNNKVVSQEKAIKTTTDDNKEYLNKVFQPRLTISNSKFPTTGYYTIQNTTSTSVYLEKATINVYGEEDEIIYTTTLNIYKLYDPGSIDYIKFQIPQDAINITRIKIELV